MRPRDENTETTETREQTYYHFSYMLEYSASDEAKYSIVLV